MQDSEFLNENVSSAKKLNISFGEENNSDFHGPPVHSEIPTEKEAFGVDNEEININFRNPALNENEHDHEHLEENNDDEPYVDKYMGMFTAKNESKKKSRQNSKIDATRMLLNALFVILSEYVLYFILQITSYLFFPKFWINSTYVLGTVFFLLYLIIVSFIIRLEGSTNRYFLLVLKGLEFIVYLILISWGVAYLDFSLLSLSYMMIFNILALILNVS